MLQTFVIPFILFAGNIIDMDIGLSMAQEFDPMTNSQVTITGNLYQYPAASDDGRDEHASLCTAGAH